MTTRPSPLRLIPLHGLPEIAIGSDLARLIRNAAGEQGVELANRIVVVCQKIVSKAEGRLVPLADVRAFRARPGDRCRARPRPAPGRGRVAGEPAHRAPGPRSADHGDAPRLRVRELGRRSLERPGPRHRRPAARSTRMRRRDACSRRSRPRPDRPPSSSATPSAAPGARASSTSPSAPPASPPSETTAAPSTAPAARSRSPSPRPRISSRRRRDC